MVSTDQVYPQRVIWQEGMLSQDENVQRPTPANFKNSDNRYYLKAGKVLSVEQTQTGVMLTLSTERFGSHMVFTHETGMLQPGFTGEGDKSIFVYVDLFRENILRVRYAFHTDIEDPYARIPKECRMLVADPEDVSFIFGEDEQCVTLTTESMKVKIEKRFFCIHVEDANGHEYMSQFRARPHMPMMTCDMFDMCIGEENEVTFDAFTLAYDEEIYGLGERFDSMTRRGRSVDFHNKDAIGTTSRRTYMNIPFLMSSRGYGLFLNSSAPTSWEIGTSEAFALQFGVSDDQMDYFIMPGKTPADILKSYCTLTGFSKLPPLWSFGLWMSRNSYVNWDVAEDVGRQLRAHDIPCDVLHLDTAWFTEDWNCDLRFSKERFPNPEKHLADLKKDGFHVSLWQYPHVPPKANNINYQEGKERGYFATDDEGNPYKLPPHCHGGWVDDATIDFTNPEAAEWYGKQIEQLIAMGAGAIKTDFGEGIPEYAHYRNLDGKYIHNFYTLPYNHAIWKATKAASGEDIVWARSGTAGSQRFPLHWGGDSQCTFEGLAGTLRAALSSGMSGIPFFSHDIGGFIGLPSAELYVRWSQMGLFSSHSRCHGAGNDTYREPWRYGEEACNIFRDYDKLRYSLMPYIMEQAQISVDTGMPMMRAMFLMHPKDRNVRAMDDEYYFGENLLVAPILRPMSESDVRDVYLPAGTWYDYWTKEKIESKGQWIQKKITLSIMPIYVKGGSTLSYCEPKSSLAEGMGPVVKTEEYPL